MVTDTGRSCQCLFKKKKTYGAVKRLARPTDKKAVIAFRGYEGQKEKLKTVSDWQERLRLFLDELIGEGGQNG